MNNPISKLIRRYVIQDRAGEGGIHDDGELEGENNLIFKLI